MNNSELKILVNKAVENGKLLDSSAKNITSWLDDNFLPEWALKSLVELFEQQAYEELNDRFIVDYVRVFDEVK